ncbi:MAG: pyrroline-5-carboxylate reductase family protein, partial [Dehalococcoidia bacterium]
AEATGKHLADLRNEVTSPAGTTTEGLRALEKAGMRLAFIEAVQAAYDKAKRLGG